MRNFATALALFLLAVASTAYPGTGDLAGAGASSTFSFSSSTVSSQVLSRNPARVYLFIQNNGSNTVYVKPDSVHTGTEGIALGAGSVYSPVPALQDPFWVKSSTGSNTLYVIEGIR